MRAYLAPTPYSHSMWWRLCLSQKPTHMVLLPPPLSPGFQWRLFPCTPEHPLWGGPFLVFSLSFLPDPEGMLEETIRSKGGS